MLARIIQEQGRAQLNSFPDGFGSTGSPDCRGFTTDEFSHIDFSKINFSEYINANEAKMQTNVQSAVNKMQQQSTGNLQKAVQPAQ
jgi:conjugal transfer mating pair stabilization protein TraN